MGSDTVKSLNRTPTIFKWLVENEEENTFNEFIKSILIPLITIQINSGQPQSTSSAP